jgi:hypothetical protein
MHAGLAKYKTLSVLIAFIVICGGGCKGKVAEEDPAQIPDWELRVITEGSLRPGQALLVEVNTRAGSNRPLGIFVLRIVEQKRTGETVTHGSVTVRSSAPQSAGEGIRAQIAAPARPGDFELQVLHNGEKRGEIRIRIEPQ